MAMNLNTYSTKLREKTINDIKAIVAVNPEFRGERELIEKMLAEYKANHPDQAKKAEEYVKLLEKRY